MKSTKRRLKPFFILIYWKAFLSSFEKFTDRELLLPVEVPWTTGPNHFWCRTCELVNNKVVAISQDIHSILDWMKKMSNMSWIHWVSTSDWNFSRFFLSHNFENWQIFISLEIKNSRSFISKNCRKPLDDRLGCPFIFFKISRRRDFSSNRQQSLRSTKPVKYLGSKISHSAF